MDNAKAPPKMRVMDMTQGNPVKLILAFSVPLFIGNIFQQIYSMVDTAVAGYCLGDGAIAVICAGMAATIAYNLFSSILRAFGNSRTSLYFLIISSVLNMGMDVLFVAVLELGIAGAALAIRMPQSRSMRTF